MKKLFVYGSLREGSFNYQKALTGKVISREMGKTIGNLFHLENKGYPALVQGNNEIFGEIITIESEEILKTIDSIEHYNTEDYIKCEYLRKPIKVVNLETETIEVLDAYVYNINNKTNHNDVMKIVASGDWLKYIESKDDNV